MKGRRAPRRPGHPGSSLAGAQRADSPWRPITMTVILPRLPDGRPPGESLVSPG